MSDDFLAKDWDARWRDRRSAEADGITQSQLAGATNDLQAQIISQLENDNRFLLNRIKSLEADMERMEQEAKFATARDAALLAEVRALIEEIRKCPDDDHVHELHVEDVAGYMPIFDVFRAAFNAKAKEIGLDDPDRFF